MKARYWEICAGSMGFWEGRGQKAEVRRQKADCRLQIADFKNQRLDAELLSNDGDQFTVETPREERARALGGMPFTMSLMRILTSAF